MMPHEDEAQIQFLDSFELELSNFKITSVAKHKEKLEKQLAAAFKQTAEFSGLEVKVHQYWSWLKWKSRLSIEVKLPGLSEPVFFKIRKVKQPGTDRKAGSDRFNIILKKSEYKKAPNWLQQHAHKLMQIIGLTVKEDLQKKQLEHLEDKIAPKLGSKRAIQLEQQQEQVQSIRAKPIVQEAKRGRAGKTAAIIATEAERERRIKDLAAQEEDNKAARKRNVQEAIRLAEAERSRRIAEQQVVDPEDRKNRVKVVTELAEKERVRRIEAKELEEIVLRAYKDLEDAGIIGLKYKAAIAEKPNLARQLAQAFIILDRAKLLNSENYEKIINDPTLEVYSIVYAAQKNKDKELYEILEGISIESQEKYTVKIMSNIEDNPDAIAIARCCVILDKNKQLSEKAIDALAIAYYSLHEAKIAEPQYTKTLEQYPLYAKQIATDLVNLKRAGQLNANNFQKILKCYNAEKPDIMSLSARTALLAGARKVVEKRAIIRARILQGKVALEVSKELKPGSLLKARKDLKKVIIEEASEKGPKQAVLFDLVKGTMKNRYEKTKDDIDDDPYSDPEFAPDLVDETKSSKKDPVKSIMPKPSLPTDMLGEIQRSRLVNNTSVETKAARELKDKLKEIKDKKEYLEAKEKDLKKSIDMLKKDNDDDDGFYEEADKKANLKEIELKSIELKNVMEKKEAIVQELKKYPEELVAGAAKSFHPLQKREQSVKAVKVETPPPSINNSNKYNSAWNKKK